MENLLAIIIPAYKGKYLGQTLDALKNQTNKKFNLYIGDDCSPDDIENIVAKYQTSLNIRYKRFDHNLGGTSLTGHWERCIQLTNNEPWIWLLPDDDVPSINIVTEFYITLEEKQIYDVYRFHTSHINEKGDVILETPTPPVYETGIDFIINKLLLKRSSSVAEYIFSKSTYLKNNGFIDLPLAWGSDNLAWLYFSQPKGIKTISNGKIYLRQSKSNISTNSKLNPIKLDAKYKYLNHLTKSQTIKKQIEKRNFSIYDIITKHLFLYYKDIKFNPTPFQTLVYSKKNNELLKGGYIRNLYRLIRYKFKL